MIKPVEKFLKIVLAVSRLVGGQTGVDPLLSRPIYDYEVVDPGWNWKEIDREIVQLKKDLPALPPLRANFLGDFLKSFEVMAKEGLGATVSYQEKVQAYRLRKRGCSNVP